MLQKISITIYLFFTLFTKEFWKICIMVCTNINQRTTINTDNNKEYFLYTKSA